MEKIRLEQLTHENFPMALKIRRDDIPTAWVDDAEAIMEFTDYGAQHHLIGHTYLAFIDATCVGIIMIGEALEWNTDPVEMKGKAFYRIMGFTVDKEYRNHGIGSDILEKAIEEVYDEFGKRPIALGVHKENIRVRNFYERHGFKKTGVFEGDDEYYLRLLGES